MERPSGIIAKIRAALGPHLVKGKYRKHIPKNAPKSWGCCYIANEALFFLWGKANGYTPMRVPCKLGRKETGMHWFLEHRASGLQVDITADQFKPNRIPDYEAATPCGFLTKQPSQRAQAIIDSVLATQ